MRAPFTTLLSAIFSLGLLSPVLGGMEIIAHRGAMKLAPENTLASQRLAYELGADTVECDVRVSKDLVPVILHDHDLDRTTNATGLIGARTLEELKLLDAGGWFGAQWAGEQIPTLAEMLAVAKLYNRQLLLHIKSQYIYPQVVEVIKASGISLRQICFLTDWREVTLDYVRLLPGAKVLRGPTVYATGTSIAPDKISAADFEALRAEGVSVLVFGTGDIARADIRRIHAAGFETSLLYSNPVYGFFYEDAGLHSFWTDFADVTVSRQRRMSEHWANWADASGLSPDQRCTWQDADGDGVNNLSEYALGTDPLQSDQRPSPAPGFLISGSSTRSLTATTMDWTVDLRENWSQFLNVTPQQSTGDGAWADMAGSCCTPLTPSQLLFKFPVTTSSRKFFRLKFDLQR